MSTGVDLHDHPRRLGLELGIGEEPSGQIVRWGDGLQLTPVEKPGNLSCASLPGRHAYASVPAVRGRDVDGDKRSAADCANERVVRVLPLFGAAKHHLDGRGQLGSPLLEGVVDEVPVDACPNHEDVDVVGERARFTLQPGSPTPEQIGLADLRDARQGFGENTRNPEGTDQQLLQRFEERRVRVRRHQLRSSDPLDFDETALRLRISRSGGGEIDSRVSAHSVTGLALEGSRRIAASRKTWSGERKIGRMEGGLVRISPHKREEVCSIRELATRCHPGTSRHGGSRPTCVAGGRGRVAGRGGFGTASADWIVRSSHRRPSARCDGHRTSGPAHHIPDECSPGPASRGLGGGPGG